RAGHAGRRRVDRRHRVRGDDGHPRAAARHAAPTVPAGRVHREGRQLPAAAGQAAPREHRREDPRGARRDPRDARRELAAGRLGRGRWGFEYFALLVTLYAIGASPDPWLVLIAFTVASVLTMIPFTPGGLGF